MEPGEVDRRRAAPGSGWESVRGRVLAALAEDPCNEELLRAALDREEAADPAPEQRVVAALTGLRCAAAEATGLLDEALARREAWSAAGGRPVPLRAALFEALAAGNRRRAAPLELILTARRPASARGIADAATTATSAAALLAALQAEIRRARRFRQPAAVARLHLDGAAERLDRAGTVAHERLLGEVALAVRNEIRDVDWTARRPDGDLIIFLAGTDRLGAGVVGQRLLRKLAGGRSAVPGGGAGASIGLAVFPEDGRSAAELLDAAERGVLRARAAGGGRVADPAAPEARHLLRLAGERLRVVVRALPRGSVAASPDCLEGVLFRSTVPYDLGTLVELDCLEAEGTRRARIAGRVVQLEERPGGGFDIGVAGPLDPVSVALLGAGAPVA